MDMLNCFGKEDDNATWHETTCKLAELFPPEWEWRYPDDLTYI